ncbi:MAG: 9-O-acetylesterase [Gemmatales bacterium]|nr:MAG: 9-O-acetylesterase [Gemmatales bacterium]
MKKARISLFAGCLVAVVAVMNSTAARGDVRVAGVFSDHMVLQCDAKVPVWGYAEPGETVTVAIAGQTHTAKTNDDRTWSVSLTPLPAGGPFTLSIKGKENALEIKDVLIGEVWLCSGQSNMAWKVARAANAAEEAAAAKYPKIRMLTVPRKSAAAPANDVKANWVVCSPETVGQFSATAYFFGRKLHQELGVPVGLINSSVGGTPIEAWTSEAAQKKMAQAPEVQKYLQEHKLSLPAKGAGGLYNAMIHPLAPYAIRGVIWYQGERNSRFHPYLYRYQLPALIADWRALWRQGDFPFLFVQLPNYLKPQSSPSETNGWVLIREAMLKTLAVANTGMAVTIDIGEANNIHPKNKQDVGLRLALWALAKTYGKDIVPSGPIYKAMKKQDNKIIVTFDHVGSGLATRDGKEVRGFAVAGKDRKFVWADARIVGDTIEVSSSKVADPVAVRYAWSANPDANLINKEQLPASPFRTDNWEE